MKDFYLGNNKTTLERPYWGTLEDKRKKVRKLKLLLILEGKSTKDVIVGRKKYQRCNF